MDVDCSIFGRGMRVICDPLKCLSPNIQVSGVHGSWVMRELGTWGKNCSLGENSVMIRNIIVQQIQQHISKSWTHFLSDLEDSLIRYVNL